MIMESTRQATRQELIEEVERLRKELIKEKEKNKELEKQLQDIHDNFCKFNWQESNAKQIHNQLADLYESIYRK